jgi:hypothetical protein
MTISRFLAMCGLPTPDGTDDTAQFLVDERLRLAFHLPEGGEYLHLRAVVAELPQEMRGSRIMEIATANYNGALTGGGALGLHPDSGQVMLFLSVPCGALNAGIMEATVGRFVDTALFWMERFLAPSEAAAKSIPTRSSTHSWIQG